jgi:hypothetical protein
MAGIDINSILGASPDNKTAIQKLASLLIKKVGENETLIKTPLDNLLKSIPTDGTCPDPVLLQNILDKRDNIVEFLNKFGSFLDTTTKTYTGVSVAFDVLLTTIQGINLSKTIASGGVKILPTAPGFVTALLSDLGDISDKLTFDSLGESKLAKIKNGLDTLNIALTVVSSFIKSTVGTLNSIDALLASCLNEDQKTQLISVANNLASIPVEDLTYKGFIFKIEEAPFSSTVIRKKAIAFNQSGIPLLETQLSFTTNEQTLINELKLIIDRDNLKAY